MSNGRLFGTDGVRGRVGEAPMTPEMVMRLGHAAGRVLAGLAGRRRARGAPAVLIGADTRISGYMIEAALGAGFASAGVNVVHAGVLPTPAVAYLTRTLGLQAGVVVSASHNPFEDNGIKFFSARGDKLPDAVERAIEAELQSPLACVPPARLGTSTWVADACSRYVEFCKRTAPADLVLRGMRLVVDCAHGAGYRAAPEALRDLGAEVVVVGGEPNGRNINDHVGATVPDHLAQAVRRHRADVGIALDGDGDRLLMADGDGTTYDGDQLLYVIARHWQQRGEMTGGVVGTVMTNFGLEQALGENGIPFMRTAVGDRFVMEALVQRQWLLGGETSGHIICRNKHSTGDGIVAALQVLAAMRRSRRSLAQLTHPLTLCPQKLINVRIAKDAPWRENLAIARLQREIEKDLAGAGRVLLRASGTEPVLRVMVEARSPDQAESLACRLAEAVATELAGEPGLCGAAEGTPQEPGLDSMILPSRRWSV